MEIRISKEIDLKIIKTTSYNIVYGQEIWVSGKILAKRRMIWHSKITYLELYEYVDEMLTGQFKKWRQINLHKFHSINGTEVKDEIEFELQYEY